MATVLADSPPAPSSEQAPAEGAAGAPNDPAPGQEEQAQAQAERRCAKCAAPMAPGQDWCLQCGTGAPQSLGGARWSSAATILAVTAVLALGAAAAAYAALSKKSRTAPVVTKTVAQATTPAPATTPGAINPGTPTTVKPLGTTAKPPKIPLQQVTPTAPATTPAPTTTPTQTKTGETGTSTTPSTSQTGGSGGESQPAAILLDTNAASTYNPYNYPAGDFGDPSLAIDGDTSTGWTAAVNPETAPKLAEGVVIELKTARKLSAAKLVTTTPGMTVQVYGAAGKTVPPSITDPAWVALTHAIVVHKRHARLGLQNKKRGFTFLALWISRAPAASGQSPARVTVNELELFPAA